MTGFPVLLANVMKHPRRYNGVQPTPVFLPRKSHGQRSLVDYSHRVKKSWTLLSDWAIRYKVRFLNVWLKSYSYSEEVSIIHPNSKILKIRLIFIIFFPSNMPFSELWVARIQNFWKSPRGSIQGNHKDISASGVTAFTCDLQNSTTQPFFDG